MSLFRISRELQLGVGHQGEPTLQVPAEQGQERKRTALWRGQGSWGDTVHRVWAFSLAESLSGRKRSLSFSCRALLSSESMRAPPSGLPTGLFEVPVLIFFLIYLFQLEANYFTVLWWFCHTLTWISHGYTFLTQVCAQRFLGHKSDWQEGEADNGVACCPGNKAWDNMWPMKSTGSGLQQIPSSTICHQWHKPRVPSLSGRWWCPPHGDAGRTGGWISLGLSHGFYNASQF